MGRLEDTIKRIDAIDKDFMAKAQGRLDSLTKPQGSLGRLEDIAKQVVGMTRNESPKTKDKVIFTMAGDHGVVEEGVSAFPQEVTPQMVYNFLRGGAGINVLARHIGARVIIVDMGVAAKLDAAQTAVGNFVDKKIAFGTKNMARTQAMTRAEAISAIEAGIDVFEKELKKGVDIAGTGDMGIGNTTPSSAIVACLTRSGVGEVTGKGTGIDDKALLHKVEVIERAIRLNKPDPEDAIDVLSKIGGFEIGGLCGIILASAANKKPVVIDGFISGAAAALAYKLEPKARDYMIASHCSVERGHKIALDFMDLEPLLDFNLRLGEGTGAALGVSHVEAGIKILTEMATFASAAVSEGI